MVSSNDVTITELADGALIVQRLGLPDAVIHPEVVIALREHFAGERMPEDVQAIVERARDEEIAALAAVIETIRRNWRTQKPEIFHSTTKQIIDRAPADVLAERDARIRAEVIEWAWSHIDDGLGGRAILTRAREHFGLSKGADRG